MYSRPPNRDELEVWKKVETDDCCIRNQVVGGRLGGTCGTPGRAQSSSSTPPRFPMPPHYAAGKWGMRDRAEVTVSTFSVVQNSKGHSSGST